MVRLTPFQSIEERLYRTLAYIKNPTVHIRNLEVMITQINPPAFLLMTELRGSPYHRSDI